MALRVKLKRDGFERRAKKLGLDSQAKQAREIGVHDSIHSRALAGHIEPSGPYIIGVLLMFADDHTSALIASLFEVDAA